MVAPLAVQTATLPSATVGTGYRATLSATGGAAPYTWTVPAGKKLPAGLTLSATGILSGTPTGIGTFTVPVEVSDTLATPTGTQTATRALDVVVVQAAWAGHVSSGWPYPGGTFPQGFYIGDHAESWRLEVTQPHAAPTPTPARS